MRKSKTLVGFKIVSDGSANSLTLSDAYGVLQLKVMVSSDTDIFALALSMAHIAHVMKLKAEDVYWTAGDRVIEQLELMSYKIKRG